MLYFQQKYVSFVFYLSLSPFFSFELRWPAAHFLFSLSFTCSIFQVCGHDNLFKLTTLDNTDTESISVFRFRLYWLFCCLCFTRRRWLCDFPPNILELHLGAIPVDWVILHCYACGADVRPWMIETWENREKVFFFSNAFIELNFYNFYLFL